jgi:uncharacterized protein (TIGR02646 family)
MRAITKGPEPPSLTAHRQTPHANYDNYNDKDGLRRALVTEQQGICCYCMARIRNRHDNAKIEHWQCQDRYPGRQLDYLNLLGACKGGEKQPPHFQHCDTRKGSSDLRFNPAESVHRIETRIRYESDGAIRSDDEVFDTQLNSILNLNLQILKNNRKNVLDAILDWWRSEKSRIHGPVPIDRFARERDKFVADNAELEPFCQVAAWWLGQRLARMAA